MIKLDESQEKAVTKILSSNHRINALTGGGGYGKTTVVKTIVKEAIESGTPPEKIFFAAATGKAAKVLHENIKELGLPNKAMTVHRLLGCRVISWDYDRDSQLDADLVFVDESSMLDSLLFNRIIYSISANAKLVFIGDPAQLNPVGAGCPFINIVDSERCQNIVHRLKICWRQRAGSLIANASENCRSGKKIVWGSPGCFTLHGKIPDDLFLHETDKKNYDNNEDRHNEILNMIATIAKPWFDERSDFVILSPQHNTEVGITAINKYLQQTFNPRQQGLYTTIGVREFRIGDRVKQTKNNYKLSCYNGYVGTIIDVGINGSYLDVDFDGEIVRYTDKKSMFDLTLGYCISYHSAQGSGYNNGIMIVDKSHTFILNRQLLYVGFSRFIKKLHVIGQDKTITHAIKKNTRQSRQTYLKDILKT